nr:PREDICTED: glycoprotein endo-alpha-1,2-mannosidase-like isoform X2 [Bemisia tabaci]
MDDTAIPRQLSFIIFHELTCRYLIPIVDCEFKPRSQDYDGEWRNWNSDSTLDSAMDFPPYEYNPPADIASVYYPYLGCYSSRNLSVLSEHMKIIRNTSIGVVAVSWCPLDEKGFPTDLFRSILDSALKNDLRIAIHFQECGQSKNMLQFAAQVQKIINNFGNHSALHRILHKGANLPIFYIYASDNDFPNQYRSILHQHGNMSIRGTMYDGVFLGLLTNYEQLRSFKLAQFDGFYTYYGSNGLSYGSSWKNWQNLAKYAQNNGLLFSPSVAPGFSDTSVKFWNSYQEKHRRNGRYYEVAWRAAITTSPRMISITSFNDWRGGTQIEPATPQKSQHYIYRDYSPYDHYFYTNLTKYWLTIFTKKLIRT